MLMGTGSDVGKSLLTAGLCRLLTNRGYRVRPFKPQNMSNNAAVTSDGKEIGRAQALQARACRTEPSVDMNPVLLKPQSDVGAQVVVRGEVMGNASAAQYQQLKSTLPEAVLASFENLRSQADFVLVEGAGSPAEVNLREGDIANMGFALSAGVPVVVVGDIERGGVIASFVGTHQLLPPDERGLIRGFITNKFRGDVSLFDGGRRAIAEQTGWADLGVVPWLSGASRLPEEDAVRDAPAAASAKCRIAVPMLSRIANTDDFDPLRAEPEVELCLVPPGRALPVCDMVVLPGTKATLADLAFVREQGWDTDLLAHRRRGGRVFGICGGFQMLGKTVADPGGLEGQTASARGLGLLSASTTIMPDKRRSQVRGVHLESGLPVAGYEIHAGRTETDEAPLFLLDGDHPDGGISQDGLCSGTYLHGLFGSDRFRAWWLDQLGASSRLTAFDRSVDLALDSIATELAVHLDIPKLLAMTR